MITNPAVLIVMIVIFKNHIRAKCSKVIYNTLIHIIDINGYTEKYNIPLVFHSLFILKDFFLYIFLYKSLTSLCK